MIRYSTTKNPACPEWLNFDALISLIGSREKGSNFCGFAASHNIAYSSWEPRDATWNNSLLDPDGL